MNRIGTKDVPQANSLHRVCNLIALVDQGIDNKQELTRQLGIVKRELDYYMYAAQILGFAHFETPDFSLTQSGKTYLMGLRPEEKRSMLANAVRNALVFRELLSQAQEQELSKERVADFLVERAGLNRTTARRRADTMIAWLKYTRD
jgi:hypothetical protein